MPIDELLYVEIKSSRDILSSAIAIEEKYDILVENFAELEKEILHESTQHMIFNLNSYNEFHETKSTLNRRIINLLTAARLYRDQITKHVRCCTKNEPDIKSYIISLFNNEYDSNFDFRLIEAFRNHVQHCGLAIHRTIIKSSWEDFDDDRKQLNQIQLFIRKDELEKDTTFKKSVINEVPEQVNIIYALRTYMGSMSNIHDHIRAKIKNNIDAARIFINNRIADYTSCGGKAIGLNAVYVAENNPSLNPIEKNTVTT